MQVRTLFPRRTVQKLYNAWYPSVPLIFLISFFIGACLWPQSLAQRYLRVGSETHMTSDLELHLFWLIFHVFDHFFMLNVSVFLECTFLGPSRKRGPPKGYIDAIEARLHQTEALLGILIGTADERAQSLLQDLSKVSLSIHLFSPGIFRPPRSNPKCHISSDIDWLRSNDRFFHRRWSLGAICVSY
jgi:hypothetical protein